MILEALRESNPELFDAEQAPTVPARHWTEPLPPPGKPAP